VRFSSSFPLAHHRFHYLDDNPSSFEQIIDSSNSNQSHPSMANQSFCDDFRDSLHHIERFIHTPSTTLFGGNYQVREKYEQFRFRLSLGVFFIVVFHSIQVSEAENQHISEGKHHNAAQT
jgi:hypothetical protein